MSVLRHAPYGHSVSPDGRLVPNEAEQSVIRIANDLRAAGLSKAAVQALLHCHDLCSPRRSRSKPDMAIGLAWNDAEREKIREWASGRGVRVIDARGDEGWKWAIALLRHHEAAFIVCATIDSWPWSAAESAHMEECAALYGARWVFSDGLHSGDDATSKFARGVFLAVREYQRATGGAS